MFYAITTENIITRDTSGTTPENIAGSQVVDDAFMFEASATAPRFLSRINAAGLLQTVSVSSYDTLSTADPGIPDDAPAIEFGPDGIVIPAVADQDAKINTSLAMNAPMATTAASATLDRGAAVRWANQNAYGGNNGYEQDCTDFVSRALSAGGLHYRRSSRPTRNDQDLSKCYFFARTRVTPKWYSKTWGLVTAHHTHLRDYRGGVPTLLKNARPAGLVYVEFEGKPTKRLDYMGIVAEKKKSNVYIDAHTSPA